MKTTKYKCINPTKTNKIGDEIYLTKDQVELANSWFEFSEFWQPVPAWEVVERRGPITGNIYYESEMCDYTKLTIHKVRNSEGIEFCVGDNTKHGKIEKFEILGDDLLVSGGKKFGSIPIDEIEPTPVPLGYTTPVRYGDQPQPIYKGDAWFVNTFGEIKKSGWSRIGILLEKEYPYFLSLSVAQDYVKLQEAIKESGLVIGDRITLAYLPDSIIKGFYIRNNIPCYFDENGEFGHLSQFTTTTITWNGNTYRVPKKDLGYFLEGREKV